VIDSGYLPLAASQPLTSQDLNGDGFQDIVVLGHVSKYSDIKYGDAVNVPQPGRVFLGDGNGNFVAAPANLFPVDTLMTVDCNVPQFADFNADGRPDMFLACGGWDASPWPGEQNRLYLSQPEGGWRDATANLPQLSDKPSSSAFGDISGRGLIDIYVGNSYFQDDPRGLPYFLLNTGSGQFTQTSTNIPAGSKQLLNNWQQPFTGSALVDLNDDGLPELIVTVDNKDFPDRRLHSFILWNRAGVFVDTDKTELPTTEVFGNAHIDHNVERIDVNHDGLPDLVLVGTQGAPSNFDGWFLQVLVNKGQRQFVDETAERVPQGEAMGGKWGVSTSTRAAVGLHVLDFNQDGAPDFSVEFRGSGKLTADQPLIWLNDGTGHFSTLKAGDFVVAGREYLLGTASLVATRNGYSFITMEVFPGSGGLLLRGMRAIRPYRITPHPLASRN
jgi:hypothetical protein